MPKRLGRIASVGLDRHACLMAPRRSTATAKEYGTGNPDAWDQGQTPECVAFAGMRLLAAAPVMNKPPESCDAFYAECQKVDGIRGRHDGSTVEAAMKVLAAKGYVGGVRWGFDVETLVNQIATVGPVDAGTDWTADMFEPLKGPKFKGFIQVGASYQVEGGHSYLLSGFSRTRRCPDGSVGAFQMCNSWGRSWGLSGKAWISFRDYSVLLNHRGEAACATEVLVKRKAA
jgi:hypothetical protein